MLLTLREEFTQLLFPYILMHKTICAFSMCVGNANKVGYKGTCWVIMNFHTMLSSLSFTFYHHIKSSYLFSLHYRSSHDFYSTIPFSISIVLDFRVCGNINEHVGYGYICYASTFFLSIFCEFNAYWHCIRSSRDFHFI